MIGDDARWAIQKVQNEYIKSIQEEDSTNNNNQKSNPAQGTQRPSKSTEKGPHPRKKPSVGHIAIPYIQGLGESFKICGKHGIPTHFKRNRTLKQLLVKPKDQDPKEKKSGVIYSFQCGEIASDKEYIGFTARTLGKRYREHLKVTLPFPCL